MMTILAFWIFLGACSAAEVVVNNDKCRHCAFLADTFHAGLQQTANKHFAGGDTAWEEKNLGKYATSETRLIEVMEGVCKKSTLDDTDKYATLKELEFRCSALLEEVEEKVEEWYRSHQTTSSLFYNLCVTNLRLCCPEGRFGPECADCPGVERGWLACVGRGKCHGDGSRKGTGKCKCDTGYVGTMCSNCDSDYFATKKEEGIIECQKCFEGCASGCTGADPKACNACASGWTMHDTDGCTDVDECIDESKCTGAHEVCVNKPGSFQCDCAEGYVRNGEVCELDVTATQKASTDSEEEEDKEEL